MAGELVQADIERIRDDILGLLVDLPPMHPNVWYRFSFDVCTIPAGCQVAHIRLVPIDDKDIHGRPYV
jgi:hypothetical protein